MESDVYERRRAMRNMESGDFNQRDLEALSLERKKTPKIYELISDEAKQILEVLRDYMKSPDRSLSEFLEIWDPKQIKRILKSSEFFQELKAYLDRIQINKKKGENVTINPGDIKEFMRYAFSELDCRLHVSSFLPSPSRGRRVYTGQTEQPGPNPGYHP